jgi:hypothetical protein
LCAPAPLDVFTESADYGGYVDKSTAREVAKLMI